MMYKLLNLLLVLVLVGCGNSDINAIQDGVLNSNKTITVGQALNNWQSCKKTSWESFKTENGIRVVEFICDHNVKPYFDKANAFLRADNQKTIDIVSIKETFQFTLNQDNSFQVQAISSELTWENGQTTERFLSNESIFDAIYKNKISFDPEALNQDVMWMIQSMYNPR